MNHTGKNLIDIQEMNRSLVLRLLQRNNICSRATIAKESGLRQATITNIVNSFLDWGIVKETGSIHGAKGRRSIGLIINHANFHVVGIRLTRNHFTIGLFDISGKQLSAQTLKNDKSAGPASVIASIRRKLRTVLDENAGKNILCIGMAVPGPYFSKEGTIKFLTDFPGWSNIDIKNEIGAGLELPFVVDHDANAGALAELWIGSDTMMKGTIVYLAVGQGVGAGILNEGNLFTGALGIAGEIGHASININGPQCICGNRGCLSNYASTTAFVRRMREEMENDPDTGLADAFTFRDLVDSVKKGNSSAIKVFEEIAGYLGAGIVNAICAYGPNEVIVGDEMSALGDALIDAINAFLKKHTHQSFFDHVRIRLSSFEGDPSFVGSAALAINHCLNNTEVFQKPTVYRATNRILTMY